MAEGDPGTNVTSSPDDKGKGGPEDKAEISKKPSLWRRLTKGLGSGIVAGIISGALVSFFLTPTGQALKSLMVHPTTPPSCSNPEWLLQVPDNQITADSFYIAPDTVPDHGITAHSADSTVDGSDNTAWLQWWPTTQFNGAELRFNRIHWEFPSKYNIRLICVVDGWTADEITYSTTRPVRYAVINFSKRGCHHYNKTFSNKSGFTHEWQQVSVSCDTRNVVLQVDSAYKAVTVSGISPDCVPPPPKSGPSRCTELTGISEVKFYYSPGILAPLPWRPHTNQK
jgi:hypothetical protein